MMNRVGSIAEKAGLVVNMASTSHWKPPVLLTQEARDIAKPSWMNAGQAKFGPTSLKEQTPIPGQSIRKMVTKTT